MNAFVVSSARSSSKRRRRGNSKEMTSAVRARRASSQPVLRPIARAARQPRSSRASVAGVESDRSARNRSAGALAAGGRGRGRARRPPTVQGTGARGSLGRDSCGPDRRSRSGSRLTKSGVKGTPARGRRQRSEWHAMTWRRPLEPTRRCVVRRRVRQGARRANR